MNMDKLLTYLKSLNPEARDAFAKRCGTTVGYLRKACSIRQQLSEGLCLHIGGESRGSVQPEDLRPDIDWQYLRKSLTNTAQTTIEAVAPEPIQTTDTGALRSGSVRRHASRRAEQVNRRAKGGPPFQGVDVGVA